MTKKIRIDYTCGTVPHYATAEASGADLHADIAEPQVLKPLQRMLIPTGLRLALPAGYEGQVRARSGLALHHGITVLNSPGTIDSDYRGEVKIVLINLGQEDFIIEPGQRIAQLVIMPVIQAEFNKVDRLPDTQRSDGGFGSTGKK